MSLDRFKKEVAKLDKPRKHRITNSIGTYDIYKHIRKNKWFNISKPIKESEFYAIIRNMNDLFAEELTKGNDIKFPYRMGTLEIRKAEISPYINKEGKVVIPYSINWKETLKLWYEDEEARDSKTLLRFNNKELFKIVYNKSTANYANKTYFEFYPNRSLKQELNRKIKQQDLDAYLLW